VSVDGLFHVTSTFTHEENSSSSHLTERWMGTRTMDILDAVFCRD